MVDLVAKFFAISGIESVPPADMASLISYLLRVFVALALACGVFKTIGSIGRALVDWRRYN